MQLGLRRCLAQSGRCPTAGDGTASSPPSAAEAAYHLLTRRSDSRLYAVPWYHCVASCRQPVAHFYHHRHDHCDRQQPYSTVQHEQRRCCYVCAARQQPRRQQQCAASRKGSCYCCDHAQHWRLASSASCPRSAASARSTTRSVAAASAALTSSTCRHGNVVYGQATPV